MNVPRLDSDPVTAYFDPVSQITHTIYRGKLTPEVTLQAYQWTFAALEVIDVKDIRGSIYDFRRVTEFHNANLSILQRVSQKANIQYDFSHIPVALIVSSLLQEHLVLVYMKVSPQEKRKRIVKSEPEALAFINEWHKRDQLQVNPQGE